MINFLSINRKRLNESENDDLTWAQDIVDNPIFSWGAIKSQLNDGDLVSVTGDIIDSEGEWMGKLKDEHFIVKKIPLSGTGRIALRWVNDIPERPKHWDLYSDVSKDWVLFTAETEYWDDDLEVQFIKREDYPF